MPVRGGLSASRVMGVVTVTVVAASLVGVGVSAFSSGSSAADELRAATERSLQAPEITVESSNGYIEEYTAPDRFRLIFPPMVGPGPASEIRQIGEWTYQSFSGPDTEGFIGCKRELRLRTLSTFGYLQHAIDINGVVRSGDHYRVRLFADLEQNLFERDHLELPDLFGEVFVRGGRVSSMRLSTPGQSTGKIVNMQVRYAVDSPIVAPPDDQVLNRDCVQSVTELIPGAVEDVQLGK